MRTGPFSFGTIILGGGALLLFLALGVGFLLPGTWSARSERLVHAPPEAVYPFLDAPSGWRRWTPWPESGLEETGPPRGAGARMSWNDLDVGNGTFEVIDAVEPTRVDYRVTVQDSSLVTVGVLELAADPEGTRVTWREEGDFGWNPLMGYWALFMERVQSQAMERNLVELERAVRETLEGSPVS